MLDQSCECERFFDRTQILARDILDQRHLQRRPIVQLANDDRNRFQTRRTRRTEPPLAGDQLVARPVDSVRSAASPHDQRFDNPLALNRAFEFLERLLVEMEPRLKRPSLHTANRRTNQMRDRLNPAILSRTRIANQGIKSASQRFPHSLLVLSRLSPRERST